MSATNSSLGSSVEERLGVLEALARGHSSEIANLKAQISKGALADARGSDGLFVNGRELGKRLSLPERTVRWYAKLKVIPSMKVRGKRLYDLEAVRACLGEKMLSPRNTLKGAKFNHGGTEGTGVPANIARRAA